MNSTIRPIIFVAAAIVISLAGFDSQARAQSLFDRRSPQHMDMYRDYSASRRGDLLTIVISESTDVENRDERSLDKTGQSNVNGSLGFGFGGVIGNSAGDASLDQSSSSQRGFSGDSEFRSERQFFDRFTVTVVDVLPNGNLLVEGERRIMVHGDTRKLKLSGVVRQLDLLNGNTVPSHLVANLDIRLDAQGTEQSFNKQGPFGRKLNIHWPF